MALIFWLYIKTDNYIIYILLIIYIQYIYDKFYANIK